MVTVMVQKKKSKKAVVEFVSLVHYYCLPKFTGKNYTVWVGGEGGRKQ